MKILIAIKCCHARQAFAEASRQTWIKNLQDVDYKIFYGHGHHELKSDEVQIDAPDGYYDLATKMYEMIRWAWEHGYDFLLQLDDDTYVRSTQLHRSNFFKHNFVAGVSFGVDEHNRVFQYLTGQSATGPGYWLSRKAMEIIINSPRPAHAWPDEPWVGQVLEKNGIKVHRSNLMGCYGSVPNGRSYEFCPNCWFPTEEAVVAEWEYDPETMPVVHAQWESGNRRLPQEKFVDKTKVDVFVAGCRIKNPA